MDAYLMTYEKPVQRIGVSDWQARLSRDQQTNDSRRFDSFKLRHEGRQLRNETKIRMEWDTYRNNVRLEDRIVELGRCRDSTNNCLKRIANEIAAVSEEKCVTERELDAMGFPLAVVLECLSLRDTRVKSELMEDNVALELRKELCMIEEAKKFLEERCHAAWEKLNQLNDARFKLQLELAYKEETLIKEKEQLVLDKNCSNINFKPDPLRIVKNSVPYEAWLEHSQTVHQLAANELVESGKLRESLFVARETGRNSLLAQRDRVDFVLRRKVYMLQQACNEVEWLQLKTREEMEKLLKEIGALEEALALKTDGLKLCETRLENRSYRSGFELVRDEAEEGLKKEMMQLRLTRGEIKRKIDNAKATYDSLGCQKSHIDWDLQNKSHALMTDVKTVDLRKRLRSGEYAGPKTETERNLMLTKLDETIPST